MPLTLDCKSRADWAYIWIHWMVYVSKMTFQAFFSWESLFVTGYIISNVDCNLLGSVVIQLIKARWGMLAELIADCETLKYLYEKIRMVDFVTTGLAIHRINKFEGFNLRQSGVSSYNQFWHESSKRMEGLIIFSPFGIMIRRVKIWKWN